MMVNAKFKKFIARFIFDESLSLIWNFKDMKSAIHDS